MSDTTWKNLAALTRWLDDVNGRGSDEQSMRVLKVTSEVGEVADAYAGMRGQNPRKGVTHTREDVAAELCDVALTALIALDFFAEDPRAIWEAHVAKVAARAGVSS